MIQFIEISCYEESVSGSWNLGHQKYSFEHFALVGDVVRTCTETLDQFGLFEVFKRLLADLGLPGINSNIPTYISTDFPNLLVARQHFYASGSPSEPAGNDEGLRHVSAITNNSRDSCIMR